MLPLLPALILLLLNGHASAERLAADGRLPAALARMQGRPGPRCCQIQSLAFVELLRAGRNAGALPLGPAESAGAEAAETVDRTRARQIARAPRCLGQPQDGLGTSRNSRDGPLAR